MAGPDTLEITDETFDEVVLESEIPVLVEFWAEWNGASKTLAPLIDELATEYAGKVKIGVIDMDANRDLSIRCSVTGIPTVILFRGGEIVGKGDGLPTKKALQSALDELLAAGRQVVIKGLRNDSALESFNAWLRPPGTPKRSKKL